MQGYHPHGFCYLWEPTLVWTHVAADGFIALAYYSIPVALLYVVRKRRDLPFDRMFAAFAIFILACGTTHAMEIWTLWSPDYWASAWVKVVTAGASMATAAFMVPLVPRVMALPSPTDLEAKNRELERAHREIGELNTALEARLHELESVNQDLESFAYSVSHDLRAPLRAMEGFSVALLEDYSDRLDETGKRYASWIVESAAQMSSLIRDLLEYSRLARAELDLEEVSLARIVQEAVEVLQGTVRSTDADVRLTDLGQRVLAHAPTLTRMVVNLLANALTYVEDGERPRVRIRAEAREGMVRLCVEDEGIGIEPEHLERIFGVFERLHEADRYPGTGVGLAIVAKGAERMNGRVGVESGPGRGSRFWIELGEAPWQST
jgi:signal transduction histidine kinase